MIALILWGQWFYSCVSIEDFGRNRSLRYLALAAPCCAIALLFFMLRIYASADVRNDPAYLIMYTMMGAAWLAGLIPGAGFLGLSFRDDWLERGNSAAAAAGYGRIDWRNFLSSLARISAMALGLVGCSVLCIARNQRIFSLLVGL